MVSQFNIISDTAVVVPAFNEGEKVVETIKSLQKYFETIIVVDDGSSDSTYLLAKNTEVIVLQHPINLGQGAALQTGILRALTVPKINFILTFDADGQHSVESALAMLTEIKNSDLDAILGSRFLGEVSTEMPIKKKLILKLGIIFTRFNSGLNVTDTHNGLRILNRKFAQSLKIKHAGMAHASEILNHIKETDAKWKEFPAQIYYTEYSIKKGQSVLNAVNILTEMIFK